MERQYYKANDTLELADQAGRRCTFIVCEMIGRGTRSVGYLAFRKSAEELGARLLYEFCPKALRPGSAMYEREKLRFLDSAALQARIGRPKYGADPAFPLFGLFEAPRTGTLFAETDWDGVKPLSEVAWDARPHSALLKAMLDLLREIERYHKQGFLLLTLKPQNIWICRTAGKKRIRILDFGGMIEKAAALNTDEKKEALISFSRKWSAPELMSTERTPITEKADVYSAGAILYSCLCGGKLPALYSNAARSFTEDFTDIGNPGEQAENGFMIKDALCELISEMLANDPNERPSIHEAKLRVRNILEMLPKQRSRETIGHEMPVPGQR